MLSPLLGRGRSHADPLWSFFLDEDELDAPPMDWRETKEAHVFDVELPGLKKEDVRLQLVPEGRVLRILTERRDEEDGERKADTWHCQERSTGLGGLVREFRLPEDAKVDEIKASMRDGVLTILVPKEELKHGKKGKSRGKKIVEISSDDEVGGGRGGKDGKGPGLKGRFVCCKA